jgi:hypothetical protein
VVAKALASIIPRRTAAGFAVAIAAMVSGCDHGAAKGSMAGAEASRRAAIESWMWDPAEPAGGGTAAFADFGQDWDDGLPSPLARAGTAAPASASGPVAGKEPRSYWSIVLKTFTDEGHDQAAANMIASLPRVEPRLGAAHAHAVAKGTRVLFGEYEDPDDTDAQRDLAWIQAIKLGGRLVFPLAILVRIDEGGTGPAGALELRSARARFPGIDPLYTLQIAVWGQFGNDRLDRADLRRRAEEQVRRLRAEGVEAYYHHDEGVGLSMVTVGLFDRTAYDVQSGISSPELERLMQRFPQHLINGEPVSVPIDRRRPERGVKPQGPQLVLVPE